jgi:hypothetical protein
MTTRFRFGVDPKLSTDQVTTLAQKYGLTIQETPPLTDSLTQQTIERPSYILVGSVESLNRLTLEPEVVWFSVITDQPIIPPPTGFHTWHDESATK